MFLDQLRASVEARVRYQPQGKGQLPRLALVDPAKVSDVRAVLEAALGPLVLFEVLVDARSQAEPKIEPVVVSEQPPSKQAYQPDLFGAPILDLDAHRGKLPPEVCATVRSEYRSRGLSQGQFATEIGLSRAQLCNVLKGRFGLSTEAAGRLRGWMRSTA